MDVVGVEQVPPSAGQSARSVHAARAAPASVAAPVQVGAGVTAWATEGALALAIAIAIAIALAFVSACAGVGVARAWPGQMPAHSHSHSHMHSQANLQANSHARVCRSLAGPRRAARVGAAHPAARACAAGRWARRQVSRSRGGGSDQPCLQLDHAQAMQTARCFSCASPGNVSRYNTTLTMGCMDSVRYSSSN